MRNASFARRGIHAALRGVILGLCLFFFAGAVWGLFSAADLPAGVRVVADSATLTGGLLVGTELLRSLSRRGAFALFGYTLRSLRGLLYPDRPRMTYLAYRRAAASRTDIRCSRGTLFTGIAFLGLAVLLCGIYEWLL